jgi:hypothetical protein
MGSIIHQAQNPDAEEDFTPYNVASCQPLNAFLVDRKRQGGCGPRTWWQTNILRGLSFPLSTVIQIRSSPLVRR